MRSGQTERTVRRSSGLLLCFCIAAAASDPCLAQVRPDSGYAAYQRVPHLSGQLRIAKSAAMERVVDFWIRSFCELYQDVTPEYVAIIGTSPGNALIDAAVDLAPIARELPPEEVLRFKAAYGYEPLPFRVAGGSYQTPDKALAIAMLVNQSNPIQRLTFAQIDAVYSKERRLGYHEVKTWGDLGLGAEWKDRPVHIWGLIRPGNAPGLQVSGNISHFLSDRVMQGGPFRDDISERTSLGGQLSAFDAIAQGIAADPEAIGYGGFNNVVPGVKSLAVSTKPGSPYFRGTEQEVARQAYPLSRVIYIYINKDPHKPISRLICEFFKFVASRQGQSIVQRVSVFLPLPSSMIDEDLEKLK